MSNIATRKAYLSDLSDEQWVLIEGLLPPQREGGREREVDLREVLNAICYRVRTGCSWEMLPNDFPPKSTVYEYFRGWQNDATWQSIHDCIRRRVRQHENREEVATGGMIDSQSVKTTETRGERGYDAGKKVKGRKRHLLVDTLGLIITIVITAGSVQDRDGAKLVFSKTTESTLRKVWADGGYSGEKMASWTKANCPWEIEIVKRPADVKGFVVVTKRWVVERTFGWLNRYRLLSKEYEATTESSTADIQIAMTHLMLRRLTKIPKAAHEHEHLVAHIT